MKNMISKRHTVQGERRGDWVVYKCKQCSYEKHFDLIGKRGMKVIDRGDTAAVHSGSWSANPDTFSAKMKVTRNVEMKGKEN